MVKVRLARAGSKKRPFYHIVVTDSESARDGRFIEEIGTYDPRASDEGLARIELGRYEHWIGVGALPSDRVKKIARQAARSASASA